MNKNILVIGISFLFVLTTLAHMTLGYEISNSYDNLLNEDFYSDKDIHQSVFECYSAVEIPDFFEYQFDDDYFNHEDNRFEINDYFEPIDQEVDDPMDSPWPMYCHDVRHTGRSLHNTADNIGFDKWWFKTDHGYIEGSGAIDDEGVIYFGSWNNNLYAFYYNGTMKWKYDVGGNVQSSPAIDKNGVIYVGTTNNVATGDRLYAIYSNGTVKWTFFVGDDIFSSPAIAEDGLIYFGDSKNNINALYPDGTLKWRFKTDFLVYSSPAIGPDGTVYCGSHDNYLYALYPNNGTLKWKYKTGHWIRTSPCIGDDGNIYVVSLDDYLHAVYPNGTRKWRTNVGAGTSPTIGQDGTIYAGYDTLHAINPVDGSTKWTFNVGGTMRGGTPCNSADGTIYVGTSSGGKLIAINPDGTEKWSKFIGKCEFAPVIGEDGTIYIGISIKEEIYSGAFISVGYLYAFNEKDNNAPSTPRINGPAKVNSKTEIDYTFKSTSPLGNDVYYYIDWSDRDWKKDWWLGPYDSDEDAVISHKWSDPGEYTIRCRCKDSDNLWSDWSKFKVTIPRNQVTHSSIWLEYPDMFPIIQRIFALIK